MYEAFEQRKERLTKPRERGLGGFVSASELARQPRRLSSEDRLLQVIRDGNWSAAPFSSGARLLAEQARLVAAVTTDAQSIHPLSRDVRFKYPSYDEAAERMREGEDLVVATVSEGQRIVGYGIAANGEHSSEIEIIDVDAFSKRGAGLQTQIDIGDHQFGVGIGHLLVDLLLGRLRRPVLVDATHSDSRYIFRSLGFVSRPGETNPCLLELR